MKEKATLCGTMTSVLGLACPVCIPAFGTFLTTAGFGFLVSFKVFVPLMIAMLLITWFEMFRCYKSHWYSGPLIVSILSGIAVPLFRYLIDWQALLYLSLGFFMCSVIWNATLIRKCR